MTTWVLIAAILSLVGSAIVPIRHPLRPTQLAPGYLGIAGLALGGLSLVVGNASDRDIAVLALAAGIVAIAVSLFLYRSAVSDEGTTCPRWREAGSGQRDDAG